VSPVLVVTLGLLFLLPIFFTPGQLAEEFELPKSLLLAAGMLLFLVWWIAGESSRPVSMGFGRWLRAIPGRITASIRHDPLGGAVGLMLLSAVLSTLASVRPYLSLFGAPQSHAGLRTIAGLAAVYYASRSLAASQPSWFRRLALAAAWSAAVAAAYSLLQIAHLDPITWSRQSSFAGLVRSGSTVGHAYTLSAYLVTCLPLVLWLLARSRSRAAALGWGVLATASLFIVIASLSRGAWLGAGTWLELWRAGLRMFRDHPALGVGLDAYQAAFPPYRTAELTRIEWGGTPGKAQNDAIQILATQGALGSLAALAIVLLSALGLWRIAKRAGPETRAAAVAAGAGLAAYVASSLVGFGTVATSALAAALAGWIGQESWVSEARVMDEGAAGLPAAVRTGHGSGARAGLARPAWSIALGLALASVLGYFLIVRPLRGEIFLAEALHGPSGNRTRDGFLERAAQAAPWDPRYPAEVGRSYFNEALRQRDPEEAGRYISIARDALARSVAIAPENSESRVLYATALSAQSVLSPELVSRDQVRGEFLRAVALDPLNPMVLVGAERGLIAAGLEGDARELALRCARAYPDFGPPLADLGSIALAQGRTAAAAETLKLALGRQWRDDEGGAANAWNALARASLALGDPRQAAAAADSAIARNPNLAQAFALREAAARAMSGGHPSGR
jgi:tetratricopeptide (TPR) repeat protein